jgi:hypothetical protein
MKTTDSNLIKEQRELCQRNGITWKFKKIFDEWFIFVPENFVNDLKQLGYSNVQSLKNY